MCSRSLGIGPRAGSGAQCLFSSSLLPLHLPAHRSSGTATLQATLQGHRVNGRCPTVQDKTMVARTRKKRSASWWGVSEKGRHPSQALGLGRDQRGISRLFEVGVLGHSSLRTGRSVCCELAKWEVCVVGFHGMHWGRGALTVPSSVPECPRFFLPLCFTQQPSP